MPTSPGSIPPNYSEALYWRITQQDRRLVVTNLLSVPLALAAGFLLTMFGVQFGGLLHMNTLEVTPGGLLILVAAIFLTLLLHEFAHGLAMQFYGARPQYGFMWQAVALYATAPGYAFTRNQYLVVILAPLVSLSVAAMVGMSLLAGSSVVVVLLICATLNAAGASGDVWMLTIVARYPPEACVIDERDGMRVFLPAPQTPD